MRNFLLLFFALCAYEFTLTFGQNDTSEDAPPQVSCGQQMDVWQICQTKDIPRSAEGKMMKQKIDGIYEKCSGTMIKNCTIFWKAAEECFHQELDKSESDPQISIAKRQTLHAVDQCFQRTPNDPFADLFEELYPEMVLFDEGGLKPQQGPGFAGRKFLPPPQCAPTPQNLECVSKEMMALAQDSEARKASMALRRMKRICDDKLPLECVPQSPPLWMCVDRALKQFMRQSEDDMQRCMQQKGFPIIYRQPPAGPPSGTVFVGSAGTGIGASTGPGAALPFAAGQPMPALPGGAAAHMGVMPLVAGGMPQPSEQSQQRAFDWNAFNNFF